MIIFFNVQHNKVVCNSDFFQANGIARFDGLNFFSYFS